MIGHLRIFKNSKDIVGQCYEAWNKLEIQSGQILFIDFKSWAHEFSLIRAGISRQTKLSLSAYFVTCGNLIQRGPSCIEAASDPNVGSVKGQLTPLT
jgi:hypothetical protein